MVLASRLYAPTDSWLVVYADEDGQRGELLGYTEAPQGEHRDVAVEVDPFLVTPRLHFVLHVDAGQAGEFEYPGADEPLELDGEPAATVVDVELLLAVPALSVADQETDRNGAVVVGQVSAAAAGWVAIHADDDGAPGAMLGLTPVEAGESEDVLVRFDWRRLTRTLYAVLYADSGGEERFEPEDGYEVVTVRGEPVQVAFTVQGPPDLFVLNQPVVAAELVVERVFVNEPSWLVVFSNFQGFTDRLLGHTALEAGENQLLTVPIVPNNTTDMLHVQVHRDSGEAGVFEYPADDPPLLGEDGQPVRVSIETDTGNYLLTRDQALSDGGTIIVPLVVSDLDTWVVVWTAPPDATGTTAAPGEVEEQGEMIGRTLVARGVQRNVEIEIDATAAGEVVYVVLHQDAGEQGEFEFPAVDEILRRERSVILAPMRLLGVEGS